MTDKLRGVILYKGPSQIDGQPIVCIATLNSNNVKTGPMIQTWILCDNGTTPCENLVNKTDVSICGDCGLKGKICYVAVQQAPQQVYKAYLKGLYPEFAPQHNSLFKDKALRMGSYGDPVAVPLKVWKTVLPLVRNWTGYTHQWKKLKFRQFREYCMASVETIPQMQYAVSMGWRTFRVKLVGETKELNEFVCPASAEAGKKKTCFECKACRGFDIKKPGIYNVVIDAHGPPNKIISYAKYRTSLPILIAA